MSVQYWDGTEWKTGTVAVWNGAALVTGVVRQYPWEGISPPVNPAGIDGGAPATTTWPDTFDGGAAGTDFGTLDNLDGGAP